MGKVEVQDDGETVCVAGVAYVQISTSRFKPTASGHPCHWCCAWSNMRLCDQMCPWCKPGQVFIRKDTQRYVR